MKTRIESQYHKLHQIEISNISGISKCDIIQIREHLSEI